VTKGQSVTLRQQLFNGDGQVYAILDGAGIPELLPKLYEGDAPFECLYRGELAPDIAAVAPYLVNLTEESRFTEWLLRNGWGKSWGIFVVGEADLPAMRRHFRRFLTVHNEAGKPMLFRFYDPRVFRLYLPTCNPDELSLLFTSVSSYLMENEEKQAVQIMKFDPPRLTVKEVPLG
jgi:hypothetical protein